MQQVRSEDCRESRGSSPHDWICKAEFGITVRKHDQGKIRHVNDDGRNQIRPARSRGKGHKRQETSGPKAHSQQDENGVHELVRSGPNKSIPGCMERCAKQNGQHDVKRQRPSLHKKHKGKTVVTFLKNPRLSRSPKRMSVWQRDGNLKGTWLVSPCS